MNQFRNVWRVAQFVRREGGIKGTAKLAQAAPKYLALYRKLLADPRVPKNAKATLLGAEGSPSARSTSPPSSLSSARWMTLPFLGWHTAIS